MGTTSYKNNPAISLLWCILLLMWMDQDNSLIIRRCDFAISMLEAVDLFRITGFGHILYNLYCLKKVTVTATIFTPAKLFWSDSLTFAFKVNSDIAL